MRTLKTNVVLLLALLLVSCAKEKDFPTSAKYPIVKTLSAKVANGGIKAEAKFLHKGKEPISEYGFIYKTETGKYKVTSKKVVGTTTPEAIYSTILTADLLPDQTYHVQAYAITGSYTVYGDPIPFKGIQSQPPVIHGFSPKEAYDDALITITGENFSYEKALVKVKIGDADASVVETTNNQIVIKAPRVPYLGSYPITVTIQNQPVISTEKFTIIGPYITHISADVVNPGDELTIYGDHFLYDVWQYPTVSKPTVSIGYSTSKITSISQKEIKVIVPTGSYDKPLTLTISGWTKKVEIKDAIRIISGFGTETVRPTSAGSAMPRMPSIVVNNKAYLFSKSHFNTYDILPGTWQKETIPLQAYTYMPVVEQVGNKAYFIGGKYYYDQGSSSYKSEVWEFIPVTNTWTRKKDIPFALYDPAASFVLDGNIYFFSWINAGIRDILWQYNPVTEEVKQLNKFPVFFSGSVFRSGNTAFAVVDNTLWEYNALQDTWQNKGATPTRARAITFKNEGYIISTDTDRALHKYDAAENKWVKVAYYPDCTPGYVYYNEFLNFTDFAHNNRLYLSVFSCSQTVYYYEAP